MMNQGLIGVSRAPRALCRMVVLATFVCLPSDIYATDFTHFNITRIRVASLSPISCPGGSLSSTCLRVGVVVLFMQQSGTEASISTQYVTDGTLVASVGRDFGVYAPVVFRLTADALSAAAQGANEKINKAAENYLPTLDSEHHYTLQAGVTLPVDTENITGKMAAEYRQKSGKKLLIVAGTSESVDISSQGMSAGDKKALTEAVSSVGGATVTEDAAASLFRVRFKGAKLRLWVNSFIPGSIPGVTVTIPGTGAHAGKTAIKGPDASRCFLTDGRDFSPDAKMSHRIQSLVEMNLATSTIKSFPDTDPTVELLCSTGVKVCEQTAGSDRIVAKNFSSETLLDGDRRYFVTLEAAGRNPCVTVSPFIEWALQVTVLFERRTGRAKVTVDGFIEPFPAYEMYAILYGATPTTIFQVSPLPGSSPWNLVGNPNRSVTVLTKEVP